VPNVQALVRIPNVSRRDPTPVDTAPFDRLLAELARQFPLLQQRLDLTDVSAVLCSGAASGTECCP
jgi:carboxypeptidase PM20D1